METEVKIRIADRDGLERDLQRLGFTRVTPRTFERNILYDTPERRLRNSRQILRVRRYGDKWVVTHKCLPEDDDPQERHKRRVETETEVEDGDAIGSVFESLGYFPVFIYEKWRTEWTDRQGHCVLDETPLGLYAELEGPSDWIDGLARQLHVSESEYIKLSYGRLFENWREQTKSDAQHFTFADIPLAPQRS